MGDVVEGRRQALLWHRWRRVESGDRRAAVCGTAGPGVTHLFNGVMDGRKEGAAIIAIAGDVETKLIDTSALEELNPYKFSRDHDSRSSGVVPI